MLGALTLVDVAELPLEQNLFVDVRWPLLERDMRIAAWVFAGRVDLPFRLFKLLSHLF